MGAFFLQAMAPVRLSNSREVPIVVKGRVGNDLATAADSVKLDPHRHGFPGRGGQRKAALASPGHALHQRALIGPSSVLNPKAGAVSVLGVQAIKRHESSARR